MARRSATRQKTKLKPAGLSVRERPQFCVPSRPMPAVSAVPIWWNLVVAAVIAVAIFGVYWHTRDNEFLTYDDRKYIYDNKLVTGDGGLAAIWADLWNKNPDLHYYPLTFSTFWLEHKLVGFPPQRPDQRDPQGVPTHPLYHYTQMFLQAVNATLILFVLRVLGVSFPVAVFTAAFFALHPVNTATVAWMAERKNLVSGVFFWTSLLLYIYHRRRTAAANGGRGRGPWLYVAAVLAFALALCGKAAALVLAPVLIITDRLLDGRWTWRSLARSVPFFMLAAAIAAITSVREQTIANSWEPLALSLRPFIAVSAIVHYVGKMLLPINQALIYPRWPESLLVPRYWISLVVVATAAWLIWRYRKRLGDHWLWGLGLFLLTVAPVIGLKNFIWLQFAFVSDHYMYYGSSGVILMVGLLLEKWCRQPAGQEGTGFVPEEGQSPSTNSGRGRNSVMGTVPVAACPILPQSTPAFRRDRLAVVGVLSLAALVACGWRSVQQGATWKDNETLWVHTLSVSPDCLIGRMNLGNVRARQGNLEAALAQYKEEARIDPTFARGWRSCAFTAARLNRPEEAIEYYKKGVAAADAKAPGSYTLHSEYADYLAKLGRYPEALTEYEAVLKKRPPNAPEIYRAIQRIRQELK